MRAEQQPGRTGHDPFRRAPAFALPLGLGLFQVVGTHFAALDQPERAALDAVAYALLLAGPAALLLRRRYPVPVLLTTLAATVSYYTLDYPYGPVFFSLVVAFITAVTTGHRLAAWVAGLVGYLAVLGLGYLPGGAPPPTVAKAAGLAAWLLLVLTAAEAARFRGERVAQSRRTREEESRRRASEERLQIARELHDVLAHNISLINVQAGVALHLIDEQPEQARIALAAIKQSSKDVLREMRSVLGVLRGVDEAAPRSPIPSLANLDDLIANVNAAGLTVRTEVHGKPRALPAGVELAAFRILQEALTNVSRHAGAATATATVDYGEHMLSLRVDDDGDGVAAAPSAGTGSGIAGMRERVAALGGEFSAGPRPGGGFRVLARLPLNGTP